MPLQLIALSANHWAMPLRNALDTFIRKVLTDCVSLRFWRYGSSAWSSLIVWRLSLSLSETPTPKANSHTLCSGGECYANSRWGCEGVESRGSRARCEKWMPGWPPADGCGPFIIQLVCTRPCKSATDPITTLSIPCYVFAPILTWASCRTRTCYKHPIWTTPSVFAHHAHSTSVCTTYGRLCV